VSPAPPEVVARWLAAVNAGDAEGALALSAPDVRIVGPRGAAAGHAVLRAWLAHAGATFATRETYARGADVVVAQRGTWRGAAGGADSTADAATRFRVDGPRVAEIERFDALRDALAAAGLESRDLLQQDGGRAG
jgi:hypothetical protein